MQTRVISTAFTRTSQVLVITKTPASVLIKSDLENDFCHLQKIDPQAMKECKELSDRHGLVFDAAICPRLECDAVCLLRLLQVCIQSATTCTKLANSALIYWRDSPYASRPFARYFFSTISSVP